jgi:hypothetical protein
MTDNVNPDGASTETGFAKVGIAGHMTDQREGDETGAHVPTRRRPVACAAGPVAGSADAPR